MQHFATECNTVQGQPEPRASLGAVGDAGPNHASRRQNQPSKLSRRLERRCSYDLISSVPSTNSEKFSR